MATSIIVYASTLHFATCEVTVRGIASILHRGATEAERRRRENRSAEGLWIGEGVPRRQRIFGIFEAHRTLLVERKVLLRSNKAIFPVKNPLN